MIISDKHKFIFVSNPKTGTHTMYDHLTKYYDGYRYGGFHERVIPSGYGDYTVFTTLRDPMERVVAAWNSLLFQEKYRKQYLSLIGSDKFQDFVKYLIRFDSNHRFTGAGSPVLCTQSTWLRPCIDKIDYFVITERMDESFCDLPFVKEKDKIEAKLVRDHQSFSELASKELDEEYIDSLIGWLSDDINLYINQMMPKHVYSNRS